MLSEKTRERVRNAYNRGREGAKPNMTTALISIAAGAGIAIARDYAQKNVDQLNPNKAGSDGSLPNASRKAFVAPVVTAGAGYLLGRKVPAAGFALLGAAAVMGVDAYKTYNDAQPKAATAQGLSGADAGALLDRVFNMPRMDAGTLQRRQLNAGTLQRQAGTPQAQSSLAAFGDL